MSVCEDPFVPENLAGQIEYLIDNQDIWLVKAIVRITDMRLAFELVTGERFILTIEPA